MYRVSVRRVALVVAWTVIGSGYALGQVFTNGRCDNLPNEDLVWKGVLYGAVYQCTPKESKLFDRIDVGVGKDDQLFHFADPVVFRCNNENNLGEFKAHKKDWNPGDPNFPHIEVWSADFMPDCKGSVKIYATTFAHDPTPFIKEVEFSYTIQNVPTISSWGVGLIVLLLLGGLTFKFRGGITKRA